MPVHNTFMTNSAISTQINTYIVDKQQLKEYNNLLFFSINKISSATQIYLPNLLSNYFKIIYLELIQIRLRA